jgi:hypothetical protein
MSSSDLRRKSGTFASAAGYPAGIAELTGTATRAAGGARGVVREAERGRYYLHAGTEYARSAPSWLRPSSSFCCSCLRFLCSSSGTVARSAVGKGHRLPARPRPNEALTSMSE